MFASSETGAAATVTESRSRLVTGDGNSSSHPRRRSTDADRSPTGGARAVVVDDETHVADLYASYLEAASDVEAAADGEAALEVTGDDVDVELLDRRLSLLSGGDVLTELRDRGVDCRVVMLTAVEPDLDAVDVPFDDYVTKPAGRKAVLDLVREQLLLRKYGASRRIPPQAQETDTAGGPQVTRGTGGA